MTKPYRAMCADLLSPAALAVDIAIYEPGLGATRRQIAAELDGGTTASAES